MNAISAHDVTKTYGDVVALDDLSLTVETGSTFGLLGSNGAGKTTLFKLLVGHVTPDDGSVDVAGVDVSTAGTDLRQAVGYLPEHAGFPSTLTGREVLQFHARMRGVTVDEREDRITTTLATVGLSDSADRAVSGYSNGMNRRLGLATALLARPSILLLDEPTAGLDPLGVESFHDVVRQLHDHSDLTVVLSSHILAEVESLCEEVAVLHDGRLRASGSVSALKATLDEQVTVRLRLADRGGVAAARTIVTDQGWEITRQSGRDLTVSCPQNLVLELLNDLERWVGLEGFEVHEPGLNRVFERAVETEVTG